MNPLLDIAQRLGDDDVQESRDPVNETPFDPENPPMPDNGVASAERFMMSFGSPARWAGH